MEPGQGTGHRVGVSALGMSLALASALTARPAHGTDPAPSLAIRPVAPSLRLAWPSLPGHQYRIESAPAPGGGWTTAGEITAGGQVGGELTWTDTNALTRAGSQFYRLLDRGVVTTGALTLDAAFRASDLVPVELGDLYSRSASDASDAIAFATSVVSPGGPPVTHGTVRATGNAAQPATYSAQPADRLVIDPLIGDPYDVYVQELNLTTGVYQWRQVSGGSDLVFRSEPAAQATQIRVQGRYVSPSFTGVKFTVDLTGTSSGLNEVDSSGSHNLSDITVRGTVATDGFAQTVNARSRFEFVSARGASGRLQSASTSENWNNHTLVLGGDTYLWGNAKRQRSWKDGKESDLDTYWNATGTVTRNGAPFGQYRKSLQAVGTSVIDVRFQLVLLDRVVDVEHWTVQAPGAEP